MIPSANSTGDLTWHTDNWADPQGAAAAYNTASVSSSTAAPAGSADHSRYLALHRHQVLDWENAMLLAHHQSNTSTATNGAHVDSVYDQVAEYNKAAMQADALASLSHPRHYEDLLSAHLAASSNSGSFSNGNNAWGLLNTVCSRSSGALQQEASLLHTAGAQYGYDSLNGADGLGGYGSQLGPSAPTGLYADSIRSSGCSSNMGLTSFDQRRLDDIMKRELYTTHDLNSRLGLNLGGRTYFSADDFAFGRWGKRLRPNSPGCMMQPAPSCQAEGCKADLSTAKHYHRRHKVCEYHSKAATVRIGEQTQRFCQQCSRFHVLDEFDDGKRSCRKRLADHNRRRRKPQATPSTSCAAAVEGDSCAAAVEGDAIVASEHEPKLENSQEATTGSESLHTGATTVDDDQPKTTSTLCTLAAASTIGNNNEASSNKMPEHEKPQPQSKGTPTSTQSPPLMSTSGIALHNTETAMEIPTTASHLAANLSLGGGTVNILDVKPTSHMLQASIIESHVGSRPFQNSSSTNKHAATMPWLPGSKKHHNMQGLSYEDSTRAPAVGEGDDEHAQLYAERALRFKSTSSMDYKESKSRSNWMMKGLAESDSDTLLINSRYGARSNSGGGEEGGHEVLRLLGDERELLRPNKKHTATHANSGSSSIGTLAFLDRSLDPSTFARSDQQQQMLQFSSLHHSNAENHAAMSANRGSSSNLAFDSHNHMM